MDEEAGCSMSAQTPTWKLALRAIFRALTFLLPFAFAGRLDWWRGWLFVGSLLLIAGVSFAVLRRKNPDLMRRRLEWQPGVKRFERFVLAVAIVGFLSFYAVAGLDARYGWSQLSAAWIWPGIALELLGFVPIYLAIAENPFLERQVRVQTELGHHVIATGPYRVVRHPMYSGLMLLLPGCALVLGSAWGFAPITILMATFIVRTVLEDGALRRELPGYEEYCTRTRYRLVPGVW
jgi:protein-S-isoprenylcysteine O-methyltransferase Ste14